MPTRRAFLRQGGLALVGSSLLPSFLSRAAWAAQDGGVTSRYDGDTILVVIQMQGGNDGLNTVVPYGYDGYYAARPNLAIKAGDVLPLTDHIGLHPEMGKLAERFKGGQVAIMQGVGYPSQSLSHFSATDVWLSGVPGGGPPTSGWLANYLASTAEDENNPIYAASVTQGLSRALYGPGAGYLNSLPRQSNKPTWLCAAYHETAERIINAHNRISRMLKQQAEQQAKP